MINNKVNVNNTQPISVNNTKAFSLIELSIVLIIVALIIGGIISGKSLVTNSKIVTVASDVKSLNIALQSFQDSFGMLPGDITTTIGGIVEDNTKGNGDWYIGNGHPLNKESVNAFAHLSKANFINEKFEGNNTPNKISDLTKDHYIESKSFKNTFLYLGATNFGSKANTINRIMFVSTKTGNSFTPAVAKAYNCKFDNCDPFTGKVISLNIKYDLESTASNKYNKYNFNLINSAKAEEANSNACVDANGYTTTTKEVCTVNISDLNINDNKESYVTDSGKTGDVSLGDKNTNPDGSSPSNPGGGDGGSSGGGSTADNPTVDLNDPDILAKTEDEAERCGMPAYVENTDDKETFKVLTVGGTNYNFIKSFEGLPTDKSNLNKTFSATCKTGYTADLNEGEATPKITFTCEKATDATTASWVATAGACKTIETPLSKCWSASGGKTNADNAASTEAPANLTNSYLGFMDTDCCNPAKGKYVDLDLKLQKALCEKEAATYGECTAFNQTKYDTDWKSKPKQEKLIKFVSLSGTNVDLKCVNLSGLNLSDSISKFNTAISGKKVYFSYRPAKASAKSTLNDGANLAGSNFSGSSFSNYVYFGYNYFSSGNPGSNLTNANFSGSSFSNTVYFSYNAYSSGNPGSNLTNANFSGSSFSSVYFSYNAYSSGNPGSNLTNANFSGTIFRSEVYFGSNANSSYGNPGSNLTNANFSGSSFSNNVYFGSNANSSSGNPGSNLTNANFSGSSFSNNVYFGYNSSSSGNPGSNLTNANFSGSRFFSGVSFGYNFSSSYGNPGSNVKGAKFGGICKVEGKTKCANQTFSNFKDKLSDKSFRLNTNLCAIIYLDENNKEITVPTGAACATDTGDKNTPWGSNVYNPYCNIKKDNCCLKPTTSNQSNATPSICSSGQEKWDGTKDGTR